MNAEERNWNGRLKTILFMIGGLMGPVMIYREK